MPRLGELLVAAGVLTPAQLEDGLRAQVIHGARLGTNLVELGHVGLDDVAVALARQHGLPPALRKHFERCDADVQERLPGAIAAKHLVVPIGLLAGDDGRVMIAARDRLAPVALREVEAAMGLRAGAGVLAIAAELRILYFLEQVYGIPRATRFLRVRRAVTPSPVAPAPGARDEEAADTTERPAARRDAGAFDGETWAGGGGGTFAESTGVVRAFDDGTGRTAAAPPAEPDHAETVDDDLDELDARFEAIGLGGEPSTEDRTTGWRGPAPAAAAAIAELDLGVSPFEPPETFHIEETPVEHIIDPPPPGSLRRPAPPPEPPAPGAEEVEVGPARSERRLPADSDRGRRFLETLADAPPAAGTLGRIPIRKLPVKPGSGDVVEAADVASVFAAGATIEDVARAIRRSQSRGRVGELAIGALRRFGDGRLDAGILFVVRETVAIGWKGFARGVDDLSVDELAIPLDQPSVLAAGARERRALLVDGDHGTPLDRRLWAAIGHATPGEIAVAPVVLAGTPVCLFYGQAARMAPFAELFAAVTQATTSAFARLLRAAQR